MDMYKKREMRKNKKIDEKASNQTKAKISWLMEE